MLKEIENCNSRRGFTLVEVLVVIAIIGLLVGLLMPAIAGVRRTAKKTRIKLEMSQIVAAIESFQSKFGQYPPDGTLPTDTVQFLRAAFPRCPQGFYPTQLTTANTTFTPAVALVFWLGGAQDSAGNFIGFSANPQNPFDNGASRLATFFDFGRAPFAAATNPNPRLQQAGTLTAPSGSSNFATWNLYQFFPQNDQALGTAAPYLYFKAVGGQYTGNPVGYSASSTSLKTLPYADSSAPAATSSVPQAFVNPKSYQLLCPGLDGKYGQYTTAKTWPLFPAGTNYETVNGLDDMTNFTNGATVDDDRK